MSDTPVNVSQSVNNSAPVNESSAPAQTTTSDTGTATIVHLLAIFTSFVGPLIMYLIYKDKPETSAFLRSHIMNCLNFQLIAGLASIVATFTIVFSFLTLIIWPIAVILEVIALLAANQNKEYRYPIDVQLVK